MFKWWVNFFIAILALASPYALRIYLYTHPNNILWKFNVLLFYVHIYVGLFFGLLCLITYFIDNKSKRLFYSVKTVEDLKGIDWYEFELIVGETFRQSGYKVDQRGGAQADGGIDLEAFTNKIFGKNERIIVQCKHWKKSQVGVQIVREMYGVVMHEKADEVYIVTCGKFSPDAKDFAKHKPIVLVDGKELLSWMAELKS